LSVWIDLFSYSHPRPSPRRVADRDIFYRFSGNIKRRSTPSIIRENETSQDSQMIGNGHERYFPGKHPRWYRLFSGSPMTGPRRAVSVLLCLFTMVSASAAQSASEPAITLSTEEQAWLAKNHTVRVRIGDYPPT
jgi:hypothetical protein